STQAEKSQPAEDLLWNKAIEHSALLDALPAMVFFKDRDHRYLLVNQRYAQHHHLSMDAIIGKNDFEIFMPETARTFHDSDELVMATGEPQWNVELHVKLADGTEWWTMENDIPYRDTRGRVIGMVGVVTDVTARRQAEAALRRTEAELRETLARQENLLETIAALSTPVLPVHDRIIVLPLVGQIDTARSAQIMAVLLAGVQRHRAEFVILDLTGVPFVDTAVASHLLRATRAVGLLGAQCILVGLSPAIAQALVHLDVDLGTLVTLGDLQAGMRHALAHQKRAGGF
ncbi:MAG: PAS domain-containing protein, partial [Byssovorax sp.]